jgi:hypothetical protein
MKIFQQRNLSLFGIGMMILITMIGCKKDAAVGKVTGTVTLDGKPLPNAQVVFHPENENELPPLGGTDSSGHYELFYTEKNAGAVPGVYTATVSTGQSWNNIPETVPKKYLDKKTSELQFTVKSGKQVVDIELKSK